LCGVERLAQAKLLAMANNNEELRAWATRSVERMLVNIVRTLAGEYEAAAIRLRRWAR
jgi:hypothetical protein